MQFRKASRKAAKIKLNIGGPSGSGKTLGALKLAYGLCGDWEKIGVIDSEFGSGDLYSDVGEYNIIRLFDFSPEHYKKAIKAFVDGGMEVIIIDSITHEWEYLLELQTEISKRDPKKNSYTAWGEITPLHNEFKKAVLEAPVHIITTVRQKQEYAMVSDGNKTSVQKLGMGSITRDGWEYEVTVNFNVDSSHYVEVSKDRTGLFKERPPFIIDENTGEAIKNWCNSGSANSEVIFNNAVIDVNNALNEKELTAIYNNYSELKENKEFIEVLKNKKSSLNGG